VNVSTSALLVAFGLAVTCSMADDTPPASAPAKAGAPAESNPLAGPAVGAQAGTAAKPTLVQRDFGGTLVRLDVPPAEAAVKLIELDPPTRARVDAILLARSALLDELVTNNLELLAQLQGARAGGGEDQTRAAMKQLMDKAEPLRARGPLIDELAAVLPADKAAQARSLTEEYMRAAISQRMEKASGGKALSVRERARAMREAAREEALAMIGQEIRRSYERTVGQRSSDFEALLKDLGVTPEQESKIRKIVQDAFLANYGKTSADERTKAFWSVYAELNDEQRQRVVKRLFEERAGARAK
jgi:hypothetical protein